MKAGRPLPELITELQRQAESKRDYLAPVDALSVRSNGSTKLSGPNMGTLTVSDIAHSQIAEYLDIPKQFYDRLRGKAEDWVTFNERADEVYWDYPIFDALVNSLLPTKINKDGRKDTRLVRSLDGGARAFLSDRYFPLDNWDVMQVVTRVLENAGLGPEHVQSAEVTEKKLYLKVVTPFVNGTIINPNVHQRVEDVQAGFVISNSEVGLGSVKVERLIFKLQCINGLILPEAYRQNHVGSKLDEDAFSNDYKRDTLASDARTRLLKIRDHVSAAISDEKFQQTLAKINDAAGVKIEARRVESIVDVTARRYSLTQNERDLVFEGLIDGRDLSKWGLVNAVTAAAQKVDSYDRSTELEQLGGNILELPASEWRILHDGDPKKVAVAA